MKKGRWSKEEIIFLKNNCENMSDIEISKILNRDKLSVSSKRCKLNLLKQNKIILPIFCKICNNSVKSHKHFFNIHNITSKEYYDKYIKKENEEICIECGKKTTYYGINKGYSKFCSPLCASQNEEQKESISKKLKGNIISQEIRDKISNTLKGREFSDETRKKISKAKKGFKFSKETKKKMSENRKGRKNSKESIEKRLKTISEWDEEYKQEVIDRIRQTKLKKYGVINQLVLPKYHSVSYSKISQELFWSIYKELPDSLKEKTYFAELNHEFNLTIPNEFKEKYNINNVVYYYDFVISNIKFCIEFNGDRFHANPALYKKNDTPSPFNNLTSKELWEKDEIKNNFIKNKDFYLYIVWEKDYKNDSIKILNDITNTIKKRDEI